MGLNGSSCSLISFNSLLDADLTASSDFEKVSYVTLTGEVGGDCFRSSFFLSAPSFSPGASFLCNKLVPNDFVKLANLLLTPSDAEALSFTVSLTGALGFFKKPKGFFTLLASPSAGASGIAVVTF